MTTEAIGGDRPTYYTALVWNETDWRYDEIGGVVRGDDGVANCLAVHAPPLVIMTSIRRHPDPEIRP